MSSWSVLDVLSRDQHLMRAVIKIGFEQADLTDAFLHAVGWRNPKNSAWAFLEIGAVLQIARWEVTDFTQWLEIKLPCCSDARLSVAERLRNGEGTSSNIDNTPITKLVLDVWIHQVAITDRGTLTGSGHLDAQGGLVNDGRMDLDGMTVAGLTIENNGVISGSSTIDNALTNSASGEIRAGPDQLLHMTGIGVQANAGRIDVVGNATQAARIEFDGALTNAVTTGNITASHAVMRFNGGLSNQGSVGISFGTSNVYGDIDNQSGATIAVKGNSNVTFWDDLTNNGTVEVSSGSAVAHFGILSGEGSFTGGGTNFVEGGLAPGSSPGTMSFDGNLVLGASSTTLMELAGTATGEYDRLVVAGELTLGGNLEVELIDNFIPQVGDVFDLFVLEPGVEFQGSFSNIELPLINNGVWDTSGSIFVFPVPEPSSFALALAGLTFLTLRRRR